MKKFLTEYRVTLLSIGVLLLIVFVLLSVRVFAGSVEVVPEAASIGDYVWNDADSDGIQDTGETGVAGVRMILMDNGPFVPVQADETLSQSDGRYEFAGVAAGRYYVRVDMTTVPTGATISGLQEGDARALDSDFSPTGSTFPFSVADGDVQSSVDLGLIVPATAATPTATATRVATAVPEATSTVVPGMATSTPQPEQKEKQYLPLVARQ